MSVGDAQLRRLLGAASFVLPLGLYLATRSAAVQFDDAAELTLCAEYWSSAHPPGYPLWVALAHLWGQLFGHSAAALAGLSALLGAGANLVLFLACERWLQRPACGAVAPRTAAWAAAAAASCTAVGATFWQWSNSTEVYALQAFATALVLWGVAHEQDRWRWRLVLSAGIGIGLGNSHLSMVLLVPFVPFLAAQLHQLPWQKACRSLLAAAVLAAIVTVFAYAMLLVRAQGEPQFSFGEPSTVSRLWHHLRGGFFGDLLFAPGVDYAGRARVFGEVLLRHLWLGWVLVGAAALWLVRHARAVSCWLLMFVALSLLAQWGRAHVPNMDAALLPALLALTPLLAIAVSRAPRLPVWLWVVLLPAVSLACNWSAADRRGYPGADALLAAVDASLPPNALLLATGWELQTATSLAQDAAAWRPDVVVVPGSVKGTNAPLLQRRQPALHGAVRAEYDTMLAAIAAIDPDYVHTDYFQFDQQPVWNAYGALVHKVFAVARQQQRPVLLDKPSMVLLLEGKVLRNDQVHPCGLLFSVGEVAAPLPFPPLDHLLAHPFLLHDLCAYGTLYDLQTIAPQIAGYWRSRGRAELAAAAERAAERLAATWQRYAVGVPAPRRR